MSPELLKYFSDWLTWAENGAPHEQPFSRKRGLCSNVPIDVDFELGALLEREFDAGTTYPFGGEARYNADSFAGTHHLQPDRLAWVRAKLAGSEA